jgi:hypothetical protein
MANKLRPYRILFLHHSTGEVILHAGETPSLLKRKLLGNRSFVSRWLDKYNKENKTNYVFENRYFPKSNLYGWSNYPYDYYNIWVKHAGDEPYKSEPTLEILTPKYDLIIFKHCYPVSDIAENSDQPNIDSETKTIDNYKLQYEALRLKMAEFPETKFLVWTGAARVETAITREQAERAKQFFDWVKSDWIANSTNIFIFDFYTQETEGLLYLKNENAQSPSNSHPGKLFARKAAELFCRRIVEVIEQNNWR